MKNKPSRYADILGLSRPVSKNHQPMSRSDRAAQFSPFAALVGYDAVIQEEARLTVGRRELAEDEKASLDRKYAALARRRSEAPRVEVTWFREDPRKAGGAYETTRGQLTAINAAAQWLELDRKTRICFEDVIGLESSIFREE